MSLKHFVPKWLLFLRRKYLVNHPIQRLQKGFKLRSFRKKHDIIFLTFADGENFTFARIRQQAEQLDFFDEIRTFSQGDLGDDFYGTFSEQMKSSRGFGYWCWKPYLVYQALLKMKNGDMLVYADCGCTFSDYANLALTEILLEHLHDGTELFLPDDANQDATIEQWTKMDLLLHAGYSENSPILKSRQWEANRIAVFKSEKVMQMATQWMKLSENAHFIDDSPSTSSESVHFIEHRHDQAIFNLLTPSVSMKPGIERAIYASRLRK